MSRRELTDEEKEIADITGCIIGASIASDQLIGSKKQTALEFREKALSALTKRGYSIKLQEVDYTSPSLPTYIVTNNATNEVLFRMNDAHGPATEWYHRLTV